MSEHKIIRKWRQIIQTAAMTPSNQHFFHEVSDTFLNTGNISNESLSTGKCTYTQDKNVLGISEPIIYIYPTATLVFVNKSVYQCFKLTLFSLCE